MRVFLERGDLRKLLMKNVPNFAIHEFQYWILARQIQLAILETQTTYVTSRYGL